MNPGAQGREIEREKQTKRNNNNKTKQIKSIHDQ